MISERAEEKLLEICTEQGKRYQGDTAAHIRLHTCDLRFMKVEERACLVLSCTDRKEGIEAKQMAQLHARAGLCSSPKEPALLLAIKICAVHLR